MYENVVTELFLFFETFTLVWFGWLKPIKVLQKYDPVHKKHVATRLKCNFIF